VVKKGAATGSSLASRSTVPAPSTTNQQKAELLQQQSVSLYKAGRLDQAKERLGKALDLDPKLKSSGPDADAVRKKLLADYYQRAIVLYRDQKLSQAIHLWDRILAVDPGYEQATFYRAQARELQSRLKQL
jgi:tetratricopeptide (TPR) repeat protein